jgi:hypothetical protein
MDTDGSPLLVVCVLALSLSLGGCGPTYRQDQLIQAIQQICATEYHLTVSARQAGQTLAVYLHHSGVLQQVGNQVAFAPSANEVLGNLFEVVHRVILSSDSSIRFYVVLISDPAVSGVYLTFVRYLEDVRRVNANLLTPTEFFNRTVFDMKYANVPVLNLDELILNDIQLEQFLSWQIAKRIQISLTDKLQEDVTPAVEVGPCAGEFRDGEFAFTLNIAPKAGLTVSDEELQQFFEDATTVIAQVLSGYRFEDFEAIRLIHPSTGKNLILPKTRLEVFR